MSIGEQHDTRDMFGRQLPSGGVERSFEIGPGAVDTLCVFLSLNVGQLTERRG